MGIIPFLPVTGREVNEKDHNSLFAGEKLLNETTFHTLFENHPDSVLVLSVYGEAIFFNKTVIDKFGLTNQELENKFKKYFNKRNKKNSKYFKLALKGNAQKFQTYISCDNMNKLKMDVTYLPISNQDMKVIAVYAIAKDITVRIENEEEIEKIKTSLELSQRVGGFVSDITEQKEYEKLIQYLAFHDHLTELPNRKLFDEKITSLFSKEGEESFSILYVDMDRFRNINNTLGRVIGDKLLHHFGQRVKTLLTEKSLFARIGGDEFGILLWGYMEKDYPESIAKMIIDSLKQPFLVEDFELFITASIGISTSSSDGGTFEEFTKYADIALNRAKTNGKNNFHIYSPTLDIPSFKQYELERDLRKAIDNDQLLIHFQPRVEASTGKIVSAEALVRWQHPVWGLVSPGEFIPLAEENGFIIDIGDWVLEKVCQYIAEWKRVKLPIVPISINITAQRFLRSDWKSTIVSILKETNVDPTLIEFEITETTITQHEHLVESALKFLKELGIKVALDDFGTGYSSLSHIKNLSIDTIKIDQSFVSQITKTSNVEIIIKSIIFMANALNMNVVAEGVETIEQLAFLKQQECAEIQGYIFSKPIPEEDFQKLLKRFILRPIIRSEKPKIEDRRKYYRIELLSPLKANMTLTSIQGREVKLGRTEALIEDIGPGGLRFLSTIQLPVRPDITYKFVTIILGEKLELFGHITWKNEIKDIFKYGLEFTIDEKERDSLIKKLNNFSLQLKNQAFPPECSFISEDKITYLKRLQATG